MILRRLLEDESGSPSAEFALALPMILPLIFVAMEAGNFFWSQQKLVQAVRDGARYAARVNYGQLCPTLDTTVRDKVKNLTRSGSFSTTAPSKLPGLTNGDVTVTPNCAAFVDTGIYTGYGAKGAIVTVAVNGVSYRSLLGSLGFIDNSFKLAASAHSPVIGI
ncbi:TadE/TadG family type IV pilus assembly protein [Croceicoccus bisphenolivorans]|uniref:TadE/TadG family type IV pilus assembly protein n=1 Tax=Croceicoccus bisphenolivorans TaxID=1783232 RepID=UPI00082D2D1F|nr:TadE/TadG family type IV pilus assembly protein [Croceicoccus bisphenolivorans]